VLAIDCGAEQSKFAVDSYKFEADRGYQQNSKVADYSLNDELKNTDIKVRRIMGQYLGEVLGVFLKENLLGRVLRNIFFHFIKYTDDPFVYMTERHSEGSFSYQIPIKENGNYVLILKFAEVSPVLFNRCILTKLVKEFSTYYSETRSWLKTWTYFKK